MYSLLVTFIAKNDENYLYLKFIDIKIYAYLLIVDFEIQYYTYFID